MLVVVVHNDDDRIEFGVGEELERVGHVGERVEKVEVEEVAVDEEEEEAIVDEMGAGDHELVQSLHHHHPCYPMLDTLPIVEYTTIEINKGL